MRATHRGTTVFVDREPFKECSTEEEARDLVERLNDINVL